MNVRRQVHFLADTGFLICFGALAGGGKLFGVAFDGAVGATPAIRFEIERKAGEAKASRHVRMAAGVFTGRGRDTLLDERFLKRDEAERDTALVHIAAGKDPHAPPAPLDASEASAEPGTSKMVEHGGEAELIAVGLRRRLPLLMNDRGGTRYARSRSLHVEPFAESLRRLTTVRTAHELFALWRSVDYHHDTGYKVAGSAFFRQPPPSNRAQAPSSAGPTPS